jgi:hypothetical protein
MRDYVNNKLFSSDSAYKRSTTNNYKAKLAKGSEDCRATEITNRTIRNEIIHEETNCRHSWRNFNNRWREKMTTEKQRAKSRAWPALLVACVAPLFLLGQAWAQVGGPPERSAMWYEDTVVSGLNTPNNPAIAHIPNDLPAHILQPLYFIISPGGLGRVQDAVIGVIPGDIGYTGWWKWSALLDFSGRDLETDPYTNVGEIGAALCTITIPEFPGNIGACVANLTPLIDITGRGGATDFVFNVPIVLSAPDPAICQ